MKIKTNKLLSVLLALVLVMGLIPFTAITVSADDCTASREALEDSLEAAESEIASKDFAATYEKITRDALYAAVSTANELLQDTEATSKDFDNAKGNIDAALSGLIKIQCRYKISIAEGNSWRVYKNLYESTTIPTFSIGGKDFTVACGHTSGTWWIYQNNGSNTGIMTLSGSASPSNRNGLKVNLNGLGTGSARAWFVWNNGSYSNASKNTLIQAKIERQCYAECEESYVFKYDKTSHTIGDINVIAPLSGVTVKYRDDNNNYTLTEAPQFTEPGTYTVYFQVSAETDDVGEWAAMTGSADVTILPGYTVTWKNGETTLETDENSVEGSAPSYDGATPTKLADELNDYVFSGWSDGTNTYTTVTDMPVLDGDVTYTAQFNAIPKLCTGHSITLNDYINLNFYYNLTENQVTEGDGVVVTYTWDRGGASYRVKTTDYIEGKGYKTTVKLPAAEMNYQINAKVTINGALQTETNSYSVREYCDEILDSDSAFSVAYVDAYGTDKYDSLVYLVKTMLDYGAKAQVAFGRTDVDLANVGVDYTMPNASRNDLLDAIDTAIYAANGRYADNMLTVASNIGANGYYSSSLIYLSGCTLRHYFVGPGLDASKYTGVKAGYYYYVDKANIAAADLDTLQAFQVGDETFYYSALDFAKAIICNYASGYNYDLAAATYWYNQAANAYFE